MNAAGRRRALLFGLVLTLLAGPAGASPRQDGDTPTETSKTTSPGWAVEPGGAGDRSWFVYQLAPGQTLRDSVAIENPTDHPITFDIYPSDAFNTEDVGAFALDDPGVKPDDVGAWIKVGQDRYTVEPRRRVEIPFEITVPRDAAPGDHAGGIIGANTEPEQVVDQSGATVALMRRIGARVYLRVEGPLEPSLDVTKLDLSVSASKGPVPGGTAKVTYEVTNTGNVRLTPTAELDLEGLFGHGVASMPVRQLPELLPGSSAKVEVEADVSAWPLDRVEARLRVEANDVTTTRTTTAWPVSPSVLVLLFVFVGFAIWRGVRRRGRRGEEPPMTTARAPELVGS